MQCRENDLWEFDFFSDSSSQSDSTAIVSEQITTEVIENKNETIQEVRLNSPTIHYPQTNTLYSINVGNDRSSSVMIQYNNICTYQYIDCSSALFIHSYGIVDHLPIKDDVLIPAGILPCGEFVAAPIQFIKKNDSPTSIYAVTRMTIKNGTFGSDIHFECRSTSRTVSIENKNIEKRCQELVKTIPIKTGESPIFLPRLAPSYETIYIIYMQFVAYNKNNIIKQKSENWCHIRAHSLSILFELYGITTLKIFKLFKESDWYNDKYKHHPRWIMHCALMIMDDKNQLWIFDPWWGHSLQTLNDWLVRNDEPPARNVMITNRAVIGDDEQGKRLDGINLWQRPYNPYIDLIQCFLGLTIPNQPERPFRLSLMKHSLFQTQVKSSLPENKWSELTESQNRRCHNKNVTKL